MRSKIIFLLLTLTCVVFGMDPEKPEERNNEPEEEVSNPYGNAQQNRVNLLGLLKQYQDAFAAYQNCKTENNSAEARSQIHQAKNLRLQVYEHQLKTLEGDEDLIEYYQLALIAELYQLGNLLQKTYDKDTCNPQNAFSELFDTAAPDTLNLSVEHVLDFLLTQIPEDYKVQLPENWKCIFNLLMRPNWNFSPEACYSASVTMIILDTHGCQDDIKTLLNQKSYQGQNHLHQATGSMGSSFIKLVHQSIGTDALMKLLLEPDGVQFTPLHTYCLHNSKDSIKTVCKLVGVKNFIELLKKKEFFNRTPLHVAAQKFHHKIFECLLSLAQQDPELRKELKGLFEQIGNNPFTTNKDCLVALSQLNMFLYGQDSDEGTEKLDFSPTNNDDDDDNDDTPPEGVSITNIILATGVPGQPAPCAFFTNSK